MIKRLIIAVFCIVLAFCMCIFSLRYIRINSEALINFFDSAVERRESGGDWEQPLRECLELWDKKNTVFGIFLKHTDADELDRYFIRLEAELNRKSEDGTFDVVNQLRASLLVVLAGEQAKAENVF